MKPRQFLVTIFFSWIAAIGGYAETAALPKRPILLVLTNHAELGNTGKKTGFYLSEAAHPWEVFKKAGYEVKIASPKGGLAPLDPKSLDLNDAANAAFWEKYGNGTEAEAGVKETLSLKDVKPEDYSAIFFAGGHGAMWDLRENADVGRVTAGIYDHGGAVGAVCHGPAALVDVKLADGSLLVKDKTLAVFTNAEEEAVELTKTVPFLLQTELEKNGAKVKTAPNFSENTMRDGRLVTGQNPASAKKTAELIVEALSGN